MKISFFSAKSYDKEFMIKANAAYQYELSFFETTLNENTALLADGSEVVCVFVNDQLNAAVIQKLADLQVKLIALRCAGFNNVDLEAARQAQIRVVRVPAYSPYAVAEHALAMILTLNRKTHLAYDRVRTGNFSLERLMGFDLHGTTVGVIGTGKIGSIFAGIMQGLGCQVIAFDKFPNDELANKGVTYVALTALLEQADIISLQCPLTQESYHMINKKTIAQMKDGVMLINTSRGGLMDAKALIKGLKSRKIGYLGLDVYEQEENLFFEDWSGAIIEDDVITRLITFPNVLITSHQAFFTSNAMLNIADTTLQNIYDFEHGTALKNEVII